MSEHFLVAIIRRNWFLTENRRQEGRYTFQNDLMELPEAQLKELISLYLMCNEISFTDDLLEDLASTVQADETKVAGVKINREELCKFIAAVMFSEYRIDDLLLYPPEMRFKEIKEFSFSIGMKEDMLRRIDSNWHAKIRAKVLE